MKHKVTITFEVDPTKYLRERTTLPKGAPSRNGIKPTFPDTNEAAIDVAHAILASLADMPDDADVVIECGGRKRVLFPSQ
jgi:hypothetical protein